MKNLKKLFAIGLLLFSIHVLAQDPHSESGLKKVIVQEILQVESYTYLNVLEEGAKKWLAVPKMEADLGGVYYIKEGMEMRDFESKELERKFDTIYFLRYITNADFAVAEEGLADPNAVSLDKASAKQPTLDQLNLVMDSVAGGVRIGDLFKNKDLYAGKKIKIKGEVTKFSPQIMAKNWVHFQDGTNFEGAYDLMVTTQETLKVGDQVVFEGVISLDQDFGAGYAYKVIMEEAVVVK
ncbi:hypothetical protein [Lutimonas vermicola]|uniref:Nucleotide-binding protein n=1 Tax=Lutimonas vermicola TaxID=414288 RepID=A0ABU9KY40_9FLAO